ncbi:hypothetical protein C8R47DRAFT_67338 [Mycena vitilis]|nr:hypothetical protein C8R47DRAFT_67338 [Mycena vitilis]
MDVQLLAGPILFGTQFNWGLLGLLSLQVYFFHISFPKESVGIKGLVYTLFSLDLIQTGFATHFAYEVLVGCWGDPAVFVSFPWTSCTIAIMAGLVSAIVQIFFAWRINTLKGNVLLVRVISWLIVLAALMQSLSAIVNGIRFQLQPASGAGTQQQLEIGVKIWLIGSFLSQIRASTPWKTTDSLITKLIYHTIETGAITAITAGIELALFLAYPSTTLDIAPYSNVVLATLNARARYPSMMSDSGSVSNIGIVAAESHQLRLRANNQSTDNFDNDMARKGRISAAAQVRVDV